MNYPKIVGTYYRVLGWIGLVSVIISALLFYWTENLHIDLSFLFFFWFGSSIKKKSNGMRKFCIGLSIFVTILSLVIVFRGTGTAWFNSYEFTSESPEYYIIILSLMVIFALPGILLLHPQAKAQFTGKVEKA